MGIKLRQTRPECILGFGCIKRVELHVRGVFIELFEHVPGRKPACTGDWIVSFIPFSMLANISDDVEEVAFLER